MLSNWEDEIVYHPSKAIGPPAQETDNLTTPANKSLESGAWTQSIIWGPGAPFRDFTQLELNEEDLTPDDRPASTLSILTDSIAQIINSFLATETVKTRKRLRADNAPARDKFNLSNDHFYEVAKEGGRHRVRQTFGQLVVEHAYPAQKLQLPFVRVPVHVRCIVALIRSLCISTRLAFPSKKRGLSTVRLCSFQPTLRSDLARCGRRRRRKTRLAGSLAKEGTLARGFTGQVI